MKVRSILRLQMAWVLGALGVGTAVLLFGAYRVTLSEVNEILDDSLRQTALLIADRDLSHAPAPASPGAAPDDAESKLVVLGRYPDGRLMFSSRPERPPALRIVPGASLQRVDGVRWHVFTVTQHERVIQVAQPDVVRRESAAEAASQMLLPMAVVAALIAALVLAALRRGFAPLHATNAALGRLEVDSLVPLDLQEVPLELRPLVRTLNELLVRLAQALQSQRRFLADAAHELRSPLTALQLQAQVLAGSRDPEERARAAAELGAGVERAGRLVRQLLQLSRAHAELEAPGSAAQRTTVSLAELARSVVARWAAQAERRGIDLGAEVRAEAVVEGDIHQLDALLGNLVENALDHTPRGGIVDVVVERVDSKPALAVRDSGAGIPQAERARVFDRFYRGQDAPTRSAHGSGLGLAIVRAIADAHRARVSLHDGPGGQGLVVQVVFDIPVPQGSEGTPGAARMPL